MDDDFTSPALALASALEAARQHPSTHQMVFVQFGRRKVGSQRFYYTMQFTVSITNGATVTTALPTNSRVSHVIQAFEKAFVVLRREEEKTDDI